MLQPARSFPVLDVSNWLIDRIETIGADEKYWLVQPWTDDRWLFKANSVHTNRQRTWSQREDVSEKIVSEVAPLLGVPCARIELAVRDAKVGCVSRELRPPGWELQTGQVVLDGLLDGYVPGSDPANRTRVGHTVGNIRRALDGYGPPPDSRLPGRFGAFDVFAGYLVLDAVVANRDRNDENWAVMWPPEDSPGAIAGSFDHARALGSTLRTSTVEAILATDRVERWAANGTAWRFEHAADRPIPTLVEVAGQALGMVGPDVREYWLERVEALTSQSLAAIAERVAGMSEVTRTFVVRLMMTNRRRVLDEC